MLNGDCVFGDDEDVECVSVGDVCDQPWWVLMKIIV
jgi:hypothetical protein